LLRLDDLIGEARFVKCLPEQVGEGNCKTGDSLGLKPGPQIEELLSNLELVLRPVDVYDVGRRFPESPAGVVGQSGRGDINGLP
jgi:hypothetical protein